MADHKVQQQVAKVISFAERAAARTLAVAQSSRAEPETVDLEAMEPTQGLGGFALWTKPWQFSIQDIYVDEDDKVLFPNARIEQHIAKAFARWGFRLPDFTSCYSDMSAAYTVFNLHFGRESLPLARTVLEANRHYPNVSLEYLEAVYAGDKKAVKRLFKGSGIVEHMRKWRDHEAAQDAAAKEPRNPRGDARENPVIGVLLKMPLPGARNGETFADLLQAYLRQQFVVDRLLQESIAGRGKPHDPNRSRKLDPQFHLWDMRDTPAFKQACAMGFQPMSHCPRYEETAVLFDRAVLARFLDASELRDTWRTDIGPFVGFDMSMRLFTEKDLAWWRLEWHHGEKFAGSPLEVSQLPLEVGQKLVKLATGAAKKSAGAAPMATFYFDGKRHVLKMGEHLLSPKGDENFLLGGLAAMCGFKSVATDVDVRPFQPLALKAVKASYHDELVRGLDDRKKAEPYKRFHDGLRLVNHPDRALHGDQGERLRAWWNKEFAPKAVKLAPKGMLKFERL